MTITYIDFGTIGACAVENAASILSLNGQAKEGRCLVFTLSVAAFVGIAEPEDITDSTPIGWWHVCSPGGRRIQTSTGPTGVGEIRSESAPPNGRPMSLSIMPFDAAR